MNIDVVGRIRQSVRGEGSHSLEIDSANRIAHRAAGTYFTFQHLHAQESTNNDVFSKSVAPLLDLFIAGYNTSLLVTGESGSGKSYTVAGESVSKPGIMPLFMEHLFKKIGEDERYMYDSRVDPPHRVQIQMYEIYNELIKDLMHVPGVQSEYLNVDESPEKGTYVKLLSQVPVRGSSDGVSSFRQGWSRRIQTHTDFGPSKNYSTVVIQVDLALQSQESPLPNKSRFTLVVTPGVEKLTEDSAQIRMKEGPTLSKSMISLGQLVASLANTPYPDRVVSYNDSKLTCLLRDELGGNCKTRALVCIKPRPTTDVLGATLRFGTQLAQVKNFPLLNDPFAQQLLTQYRSRVLSLQQQLGIGAGLGNPTQPHDMNDELRRLQTENLQLQDKNERLHQKLEQVQGKFGVLATTKTDLSTQLLMTEEEKLKVSKTLVDMQIENNKLKEECEQAKFELTNKVLQLENTLMEVQVDRDRHMKATKNAKERMAELEKDRKELADEYVVLKSNYLALQKAHEKEAAKNEELSVELLNLVNAKAALLRRLDDRELSYQASAEIERVKALLQRLSSKKIRPEDLYASSREEVEKTLFGNQRRFQSEIDRLRDTYDDSNKKQEEHVGNLQRDLNVQRQLARDRQKKIAELNAQLITVRGNNNSLDSQNNRIQHKLKDVNDEFRSRLIKYIEDIADFVDHGGKPERRKDAEYMKKYVNEMIKDLKKAHKVREEQLSAAATSYKKRMEDVVRKHEELLVAYRELRIQMETKGYDDLDLGPDEHKLHMTDQELSSEQQKQINRLREDLAQANTELESLKLRLRIDDNSPRKTKLAHLKDLKDQAETWGSLRKQLREFTLNTQQSLEQERASLLSQNAMYSEQVKELQEYIDNHLARYKDEIVRLRQMLNMEDPGGFISPPGPPPRQRGSYRR